MIRVTVKVTTPTSFVVSWPAFSGVPTPKYITQYQRTGTNPPNFISNPLGQTSALTQTVSGLSPPGASWDVRVQASNVAGTANSAPATVQLPSAGTVVVRDFPVVIEWGAPAAESASGTLLTSSSGSISDATGARWTLAGSPLTVQRNGVSAGAGPGVQALLYFNHGVYYEGASSAYWFQWNGSAWIATFDPRNTQPTESASGTVLTTTSGTIVDVSGVTWSLVAGLQPARNGISDTSIPPVSLLLDYNHVIYTQTAAGAWFQWSGTAWANLPTGDPRLQQTIVLGQTATLTDSSGVVWGLVNTNFGQATRNGVADTSSNNVTQLAFVTGIMWRFVSATGLWSSWSGVWSAGTRTSPLGIITRNPWEHPGGNNSAWNLPVGLGVVVGGPTDLDTIDISRSWNGTAYTAGPYGNINSTNNFGCSAYVGKITDAQYTITTTNNGRNSSVAIANGLADTGSTLSAVLHIPTGATAAGPYTGGDNDIVLYDPVLLPNRMYAGGSNISPPGAQPGQGPFTFSQLEWDDATSDQFGEDADTGLDGYNLGAGLITGYDTDPARNPNYPDINHSLRYSTDAHLLKSNGNPPSGQTLLPSSWPQRLQDGQSGINLYSGNLLAGTSLIIPQSATLPAGMNANQAALARNMQRHPLFFRDQAGGGFNLTCDQVADTSQWIADARAILPQLVALLRPIRNQHQTGQSFTTNPKNGPGARAYAGPPPLAAQWPVPPPGQTTTPSPTPTTTVTVPPGESPDRTLITAGSGTITDAAGHKYTLTPGLVATEDGNPMANGGGTRAMEYFNHTVYGQDNASGSWFTWNGSGWIAAAAPPAPTATPTATTTTTPTPTASSSNITFQDNFTSLSIHRTWQAGDRWQLIAPDTPDGRGGKPKFNEDGTQWWTNPFNPSTTISGLYNIVPGGLQLAVLPTPAANASYINTTAGATLPYVAALLNTSKVNYQKYGYWEITISVPRIPGLVFQASLENVQITGQFPPEIDVRIYTDASNVQTVLFEIATTVTAYLQFSTSSAAGFDASISHIYGVSWQSDFIQFYIDNVQVYQQPTPQNGPYTTNPMFLFILSASNYNPPGTLVNPSAASLPAGPTISAVTVYLTRPITQTASPTPTTTATPTAIPGAGLLFADEFTSMTVTINGGAGGTGPIVLAGSGGSFTDGGGHVWTISSTNTVLEDGHAAGSTANVAKIAFISGTVWHENTSGSWYSWNGTTWVGGMDPTATGSWMSHYPYGGNEHSLATGETQYLWDISSAYNPFTQSGSILTITADKATSGAAGNTTSTTLVANPGGKPYNSGAFVSCTETSGLPTAGLFNFRTGYSEARMLLPAGMGFIPAFWLEPQANDGDGELDIMEAPGNNLTAVYCTIHYSATDTTQIQALASNAVAVSTRSVRVTVSDYSQNYHTYGLDKQDDFLTWYVDGVAVASYPTPSVVKRNYFLLVDFAIGIPSFPGAPDATTQFPASMQIDYVRVWTNFAASRATTPTPTVTQTPSPTPTTTAPPVGNRKWYQVVGGDRSLLTTPIQTTAKWLTSGTSVTALRGMTFASVRSGETTGFISPFWVSLSTSDPLCTFHDSTGTIADFQMRVPIGAHSENGSTGAGDNSAGFIDSNLPYKYVCVNDCRIGTNSGNASPANSVSSTNTYITCGPGNGSPGGMAIQDATGPVLMDAITNILRSNGTAWENSDNCAGCVTYYDLQQCIADPNYVIQHSVAVNLGLNFYNNTHVWPLVVGDVGGSGSTPEGIIIGIPANVVMPSGKSRAFKALWDIFQRFCGIFNNVTTNGQIAIKAMPRDTATANFVASLNSEFANIVPFLCVLDWTNGSAGAQYSLATLKGRLANATSWSDAFPAPPLLDFSQTGNTSVNPNTFGAWQGSNGVGFCYNVNWESTISVPVTTTPTTTPTSTPSAGESPNNTDITTVGPAITDAAGNKWTITSGAQLGFNGAALGFTSNVAEIAYVNHVVWQRNTSNNWYSMGVSGGSVVTLSGPTTTSPLGPSPTQSPTPIGINAPGVKGVSPGSTGFSNLTPAILQQMATAGCKWVRIDVYWASVQPTNATTFNWYTDAAVANILTAGMMPLLVIGQAPAWATGTSAGWIPPSNPATYGTFCGQVAARYAPQGVHYFEIWNEQNLIGFWNPGANTTVYGQMLTAAANAIHVADPQGFVVSGGLSPAATGGGSIDPVEFLTSLYANGSAQRADAIGWHPYSFPTDPATFATFSTWSKMSQTTPNARAVMTANGDTNKDIWMTEWGAPTANNGGAVTEAVQANQITSAYSIAHGLPWAGPLFLYNWTDDNTSGGSFGVFRSDGSAKPGFSAYNAVVNPAATPPTGNRVVTPLTGTVSAGTWTTDLNLPAPLPSGKGLYYSIQYPQGYNRNAGILYPVVFIGAEDHEGSSGGVYPRPGAQLVSQNEMSVAMSTVNFRTRYAPILVFPAIDQGSLSDTDPQGNGGGYNDAPMTNQNEQAVVALAKRILATEAADPTRMYIVGASLGGIWMLAQMADNNAYTGSFNKIWAAGMSFSDQLFRPTVPNSNVFPNNLNVPIIAVSTDTDNNPDIYDRPAWNYYTGNSNYPTKAMYDSTGVSALRAGSSQFYYMNFVNSNPWNTFSALNADGGDGTRLYDLLFSFKSGP